MSSETLVMFQTAFTKFHRLFSKLGIVLRFFFFLLLWFKFNFLTLKMRIEISFFFGLQCDLENIHVLATGATEYRQYASYMTETARGNVYEINI